MHKKKRLSPFSREFWIAKGYSEEEADWKRNSFRPIRKEYWMNKGYDEEEAVKLARETKNRNNEKGAKVSASRPKEEIYRSSVRRTEYWTARGCSEEEAIEKVKEAQAFGSLQNFVKRYGIIDGVEKWEERQLKWQNTMRSKSQEEIGIINKKKNSIHLGRFESIDEAINSLRDERGMVLFATVDELKEHVITLSKEKPCILYKPFELFLRDHVPKIQLAIFEETNQDINAIKDILVDCSDFLMTRGNRQAYRRWTKEGLLRSSYEIYFYDNMIEFCDDLDVDGRYPGSNMRYDFKIGNTFIEICPQMKTNAKYREKMLHKQKVFGCELLQTIEDIDKFIDDYKAKQKK